jgi:hypothetical protein
MKAKTQEGQDMTLAQKLFAVDVARQKNMDAGEREWGESWRPTPWLSSQLLRLPCAESGGFIMDTLAVARPGTQNATTDAMATRQQRKAARK